MADDLPFTGDITDSGFFGTDGGVGAADLEPAVIARVDELMADAPEGREGLLQVLLGLQRTFRRVSWRVQELVADRYGLSPAQVAGLVSFFPLLSAERDEPDGRTDERPGSGVLFRTGSAILPFPAGRGHRVLDRCGMADDGLEKPGVPDGAYDVLRSVIMAGNPSEVIDRVKRSGLQERAGSGFPVGLKWAVVSESPGPLKVVVGSGVDSDPESSAARFLLEGDPHRVLEGMVISAYAVGAQIGRLYLRSEHLDGVRCARRAVRQATEMGCVGSGICGSDFDFTIEVCEDAGALMSGEETALLNVIQGRRGIARPRPPFPSVSGLWGRPTLINSLETLANIPLVVGGGTAAGKDPAGRTRLVGVSGRVRRPGVVEVALGTSVARIIEEAAGGCVTGEPTAVHMGGLGGVTLRPDQLDTPLDFAAVRSLGGQLGSSGLVVLGAGDCPLALVRALVADGAAASCGTCPPCRIGLDVVIRLLDRIEGGVAEASDRDRLERLCDHIRRSALCEHGRNAARSVLASLRSFADLYEDHLSARGCPCSGETVGD